MKHKDQGHYDVMPGVKNLLEGLKSLGVPVGMLTGIILLLGLLGLWLLKEWI